MCTECGAVQSERMVDEGAETRAFFDDDPHSHGMNKQGNRIGMGTFIYASHTDLSLDFRLNKHDKKVLLATRLMKLTCNRRDSS